MGFPGRYGMSAEKPTFPDAPKQKREVFGTHSNTAHAWAQQTLDHGRSSDGRMFWRGPLLHSYRTDYTIAAFTDGVLDGKRVVLFNSDTYSHSTAQHHSEARGALRGLDVTILRVPYLDALPSHPGGLTAQHEENAQWLLEQFLVEAKALANPRKTRYVDRCTYDPEQPVPRPTVERRVAALSGLLEPLRDYCTAFRLDLYSIADPVALELEHAANIREAFAKYEANAPKREKDAARRSKKTMLAYAALRARVYAFIEGVGPPLSHEDTYKVNRWRKWNAATDDRRLASRYLAAWQRAYPQPAYVPAKRLTREQWWDGTGPATAWTTYPALRTYAETETLCRRVAERLETSRGAVVLWPHAVAVFRRAQRCRLTDTSWHANGEKIPVGTFQLDWIDADGTIKAGCHIITWSEMLRLAVREIPAEVKPAYPLPAIVEG